MNTDEQEGKTTSKRPVGQPSTPSLVQEAVAYGFRIQLYTYLIATFVGLISFVMLEKGFAPTSNLSSMIGLLLCFGFPIGVGVYWRQITGTPSWRRLFSNADYLSTTLKLMSIAAVGGALGVLFWSTVLRLVSPWWCSQMNLPPPDFSKGPGFLGMIGLGAMGGAVSSVLMSSLFHDTGNEKTERTHVEQEPIFSYCPSCSSMVETDSVYCESC